MILLELNFVKRSTNDLQIKQIIADVSNHDQFNLFKLKIIDFSNSTMYNDNNESHAFISSDHSKLKFFRFTEKCIEMLGLYL